MQLCAFGHCSCICLCWENEILFIVYLSKEDVYVLCADVYMHVLYMRVRVSVRQTNACFHVCAPAVFNV